MNFIRKVIRLKYDIIDLIIKLIYIFYCLYWALYFNCILFYDDTFDFLWVSKEFLNVAFHLGIGCIVSIIVGTINIFIKHLEMNHWTFYEDNQQEDNV
jgi:hypothetical protein